MTEGESRAIIALLREAERIERRQRRRRSVKKAAIIASFPLLGPLAGQWLADLDERERP